MGVEHAHFTIRSDTAILLFQSHIFWYHYNTAKTAPHGFFREVRPDFLKIHVGKFMVLYLFDFYFFYIAVIGFNCFSCNRLKCSYFYIVSFFALEFFD